MPPRELHNPFLVHQIEASDHLPAGDVPELHSGILAKCEANVSQARQAAQGLGLLVVGEAGSGKSHMIARLRSNLAGNSHAVLAAITFHGAFAGCLWRHLRERLVSELLREVPSETKGANGLLRILRNRFPKWASPAQGGGLLDWLIGKSKTVGSLKPHLEDFAKGVPLDYAFMKVLPNVGDPDLSLLARMWLQGEQLATEDLARLGLERDSQTDLEQEQMSRKIVLALLKLAGTLTTVVICFDQVESLQAGTFDAMSLRQFATLANELISLSGPRVVITFVRPLLQVELQKAVELANMQRIAQDRAAISPLTWEQAIRLVRSRLESEITSRLARQDHADDPNWPLGNQFLERTFHENRRDLTPRHLIMACRTEFDRLQKASNLEGPPPSTASSGAPTNSRLTKAPGIEGPNPLVPPVHPMGQPILAPTVALDKAWDRKRQRLLTKLQGIPFDQVMAIGLPWLAEENSLPYEREHDIPHGLGDANLLFRPLARTDKPVGISFCNHEPQSLWRRLDRIKKQWEPAKGRHLGSFVVLRYQGERTTAKAQERLDGLCALGIHVVMVDVQQLAELTAYQQMLTMTHDGDIVIDGKPIEVEVYNEWAKGHLTSAVKELLEEVFGPTGKKSPKPVKLSAARI